MKSHEIGLTKQRFERHQGDSVRPCEHRIRLDVAGKDLHFEPTTTPCYRLPNPPQPHNANG